MKKLSKKFVSSSLVLGLVVFGCQVDSSDLSFDDDEFAALQGGGGDEDDGDEMSGSGGGSGSEGGGGGTSSSGGAGGEAPVGTGGTGPVVEPECTEAGELGCSGKQVQVCTGEKWIAVGDPCEYVCNEGACTGGCEPGTSECLNNTDLQTCNSLGEWNSSICSPACVDGACGGTCVPGDAQCDGLQKQICGEDAEWADEGAACPTGGGCAVMSGVPICTGDCETGTRQCAADGTPQRCNNSQQWVDDQAQPCNFGLCRDGECLDAVCAPDTQRCNNNNIETCNSLGQWEVSACTYLCSESSGTPTCVGDCNPNEQRCGTSGDVEVCNSTGTWVTDRECSDQPGLQCVVLPQGGSEVAYECGECSPGSESDPARRCNGPMVEWCDESGHWDRLDYCEYCYQGSCFEPDRLACYSTPDAQGCTEEGLFWECLGSEGGGALEIRPCGIIGSCVGTECSTVGAPMR